MTDVGYFEWEKRGVRWRIEVQPAGPAIASENFVELPFSALYKLGDIENSWDRVLYGLQQTGRLDLSINATALRSAPYRQFLDAILQPTVTGVGDIPHDATGTTGRSIQAGTVWTISCDYGQGYAWGSDALRNSVVFQGMQRAIPRRRYKVMKAATAGARVLINISVTDIGRAVFEAVTAEDVAAYMQAEKPMRGPYKVCFDSLYFDPGLNRAFVRAERQRNSPWLWRRMWKVTDLYDTIGTLATAAYRIIRRDPLAIVRIGSTGNPVIDGAPVDHIQFYKQGYYPDGFIGDPLSIDDLYFCGTEHLASSSGDTSKPSAGLFIDQLEDNQQSLFRFRSMYDFVKITCEALGLVGKIWQVGYGDPERRAFQLLFRTIRTSDIVSTLSTSKIRGTDIDIDEAGDVVAKGLFAVPGLEGDDLAEFESQTYWGEAVEDEKDEQIRGLWHNMPRVGDEKNFYGSWREGGVEKYDIPEVDANYVGGISENLIPWKLWYIERPNVPEFGDLLSGEYPIRPHHFCSLKWGPGVTDVTYAGDGWPMPTTGVVPTNDQSGELAVQAWWSQLWATYLAIQRGSCIPSVVAETVAFIYGSRLQVVYPEISGVLTSFIWHPNQVGIPIQIGDTATGDEFLAPGDDFFGHISTVATLLGLTISLSESTAKGNLIHVHTV